MIVSVQLRKMSIHIEQDKEQSRLAFALQSRADIDAIRLTESSVVCKFGLAEAPFPLMFILMHHAESAKISGGRMTIPINFGFKAVTEDEKTEVIAVTCRLEVDYDLVEGYEPEPDQVEAFKQGNAIFNCWTYFREYVQSTVARMNFPPVTLPFLRLVPKAPPAIDSTAETELVGGKPAVAAPKAQRAIGDQPKRRHPKE
jgi:hypothetical protein